MAGLTELIQRLRAMERTTGRCVRCGACQAVCPLFHETRCETDVARGKMALIEGLREDVFDGAGKATERISRCLLCGACETVCSGGLPVIETFLRTRGFLFAYQHSSIYKKILLRGILASPRTLNGLLRVMRTAQPLLTRPAPTGRADAPEAIRESRILRRRTPLLPRRSFHEFFHAPAVNRNRTGVKRVAFFSGCLVNHVFPEVAEATIRVLRNCGMNVLVPLGQACCGMPALAEGDMNAFRRVVRRNLNAFDPAAFDVLVTACATCTAAIRKHWSVFADGEAGTMGNTIRTIADRTMDICEFVIASGTGEATRHASEGIQRITYHDPCHLKTTLGIAGQPRQILNALQGVEFVEMNEANVCCGMGGRFNLAHYDLSAAIGKRKAANIIASGADIVATACPACIFQLRDALHRADSPVRVRHVIELCAEGLGGASVHGRHQGLSTKP